jgi:lipopolysaccharide biosynthesis protein
MYNKIRMNIKYYGVANTIKKARNVIRKHIRKQIEIIRFFNSSLNSQDLELHFDKSPEYVEYLDNSHINSMIKAIAFYLPQFHPFKENDVFWGKGFTEWTNVTKARPNILGHYQPHLPIHLGFYDLRIIENIKEQVKLANNYGIFGFCFYYYWFSGKKVMDTPIELLYANSDIDIKYCICWANESWTQTWDGKVDDVLLGQQYLPDDPKNFLNDVVKYFHDKRYIKIDNKPVLMVYNANDIKDFDLYIMVWRSEILKLGFEGIYIICTNAHGYNKYLHKIDSMVEFPPHEYLNNNIINSKVQIINKNFKGDIYDYNVFAETAREIKLDYKIIKSVMLGWDNTARRQDKGVIFHYFTVKKFKMFLKQRLFNALHDNLLSSNEKFVFINAWNEWAEGTHLEPDRKNGFGYLNAVYETIKVFDDKYAKYLKPVFQKKHNIAIIFHLFYISTLEVFYQKSLSYKGIADFYFTIADDVVSLELLEKIETMFPLSQILICENRGRDIMPFIEIFQMIRPLNYDYICKTHSKQSISQQGGAECFSSLLDSLFSLNLIQIENYKSHKVGYLIPNKFQLKINAVRHGQPSLAGNEENLKFLIKLLNIKYNENTVFAAGTMFWFDPNAINGIEKIENRLFAYENGAIYGELIHAVERVFGLLVEHNKYVIDVI